MTQATKSPPNTAKAAKSGDGNLVFELGNTIDEMVDELARKKAAELSGTSAGIRPMGIRPNDYRGSFVRPSYEPTGVLGAANLVRGEAKPGAILAGVLVGAPIQQGISKIGLQQGLGASAVVADGALTLASTILHFFTRTSFTLGLLVAQAVPFVDDLLDMGGRAAGLIKPTAMAPVLPTPKPAGMQGVQPKLGVNKTAAAAVAQWRQRLSVSKAS
jgi:hypothetical protein